MSEILLYGAYANCWVLRKREQANETNANSPSYYNRTTIPPHRPKPERQRTENKHSKIQVKTNGESTM